MEDCMCGPSHRRATSFAGTDIGGAVALLTRSSPFGRPDHRSATTRSTVSRTPDVPVRIGDDERRDADGVLTQAMSQGYLTLAEWQDRSARVATAATSTELAELLADLPVAELRRRNPARMAERAATARRDVRAHTAGWLALAALMILIWLAVAIPSGAWYPWPVWPILGTGISLVAHVMTVRTAQHGR
jgi:hypothetical protein